MLNPEYLGKWCARILPAFQTTTLPLLIDGFVGIERFEKVGQPGALCSPCINALNEYQRDFLRYPQNEQYILFRHLSVFLE